MKSLESLLKLLHIQWEQVGSEEISDKARERVCNTVDQSRIESQFLSLTKSKHESQSYNEEYQQLIQSQKPSPFFSTYLLMCAVLRDHYQQTDNMLSDLSPSLTNNSYSQIQSNTIESICDCLEVLLQEYENEESKDSFIQQILFDALQQVGGNLSLFIKNIMIKQEEHNSQKFIKAFINLQKILKYVNSSNFKEKQKVLPFIYQLLLTNTIYFKYIKNIELQNYINIYIFFSEYFLQTMKQLTDLSDIEQFQETSFSQIYCQCCTSIFDVDTYQNQIQEVIQKLENEITNFQDAHYYLIYNYLVFIVNFSDQFELASNYEIIKKRKQQLVQISTQKNTRLLSQVIQLILQKPKIQNLILIFNRSISEQNLSIQLQYDKIFSDELLLTQYEQIIVEFLINKIPILDQYIKDSTLNLQQIIGLISNFFKLSSYLSSDQKQQLNSLILNFFQNNVKDEKYFKKFDLKLLKTLQSDPQFFEETIQVAIQNSVKSEKNAFGFLALIQEAITTQIDNTDQVLLYIQILVESCKKGKLYQNRELAYKQMQVSRIVNCLLNNLRILTNIVKAIYDQIFQCPIDQDLIQSSQSFTMKKQTIDQPQTQIEIFHCITYLLFLIYQIDSEKNMLIFDAIQQASLDLCSIYYRYTINLITLLIKGNQIEKNTIYQIINNLNSIAHGNEYLAQIVDVYFDAQSNLLQSTYIVEHLIEKRVQLKLIYNKFYEISFSILFEVPNLMIERQFYLQILDYQILSQISMLLSFQDFLPKFLFYFRIERDPQIITMMQNCITKVLTLNQEPQLIQQLIETMSYHQSSILQHDLEELKLDSFESEQIQQAYSKAKLSTYRIPIHFSGTHLKKLVDDIKYYSKVVKIVLEIFQEVYQQWISIQQNLEKKSSLMYFQGGSSSVQIDLFNKKQTKQLEFNNKKDIKLSMKLILISTETQQSSQKNLEKMSFGFGSFLANPEYMGKLIILSLQFENDYEISIAINKNQLIVMHRFDQEFQEKNFVIKINTQDWFILDFQIFKEQIIIDLTQQKLREKITDSLKFNQKEITQLQHFVLGLNLSFDTQNLMKSKQKFQSQFIDSFIMLNQSFEGQISSFELSFDNQKIEFEKFISNFRQQRTNFINKGVIVDESLEFDEVFLITPCNQTQPLMCSQNVYILDLRKGIDFIHKSGGYNIFFMILDVLHTVYDTNYIDESEDLIIIILKIFEHDIKSNDQQVSKFLDAKNLQILEDHLKQWISINRQISDKFVLQLLNILNIIKNDDDIFTFFLQILRILDCQQTSIQQIQIIFNQIPFKKLNINKYFIQLAKVQLFYESRQIFSKFSLLLTEDQFQPQLPSEFFFSHSLLKCKPYKGQIQNVEIQKISFCLKIIQEQEQINLFSIDLLQILEKFIEEFIRTKTKIRNEEEVFFNHIRKGLLQMLQKQNYQGSMSEQFILTEVQDKIFELVLSILFQIRQKQRMLSKKDYDSLQLQPFFDFLSQQKNNTEVGQLLIQKITTILIQNETDEVVIFEFLGFLNQLYLDQCIKETTQEFLTIFFLDLFKNVVLKKSKQIALIQTILKYPDFSILMKNLVPHSLNKKQSSADFFAYFIIYLMEFYPQCTSQLLYKVHIESNLLNKDSLNSFLSAIYPLILQFFASKQVQPYFGQEDEQKLLNIITSFLHIEQCMGQLPDLDMLNWNLYAQVMEKGIDLLYYLNILFHDCGNLLPQSGEKFQEEIILKQFDLCRKTQARVMPNGGIKRIIIQLIAPYIRYPQMKKPLLLYLTHLSKYGFDKKKLKEVQNLIDQKSQANILNTLETEFKLPLLNTKNYCTQEVQQNLNNLIGGSKQVKKSKSISQTQISSSTFENALVFYALDNDIQLEDMQIQNLNDILGKVQLDKIQDYQNRICYESFELLVYQNEKTIPELIAAYNTLANEKKSDKILENTFDLSQIELIREETKTQIRYSIFKESLLSYELIHKLWLVFPKNSDSSDMQRSQSSLSNQNQRKSSQSEHSLPVQRDSQKKFWTKESQEQKCKNGLWFFLDEYLEVLYQELDNFITYQEFKYEILENLQLKMQVCHLEDYSRRRPQLIKVKMKNIFKPYLKQGLNFKKKQQIFQESSSIEKSKTQLNSSFTIMLQKSDYLEESLSQSIVKRAKRRSSIRSEQTIQNSFGQQNGIRKASADSFMYVTLKFNCEYITQEGAYFGSIRFNDKNQTLIFKSERRNYEQEKSIETLFSSPDFKQSEEEIIVEIQINKIQYVHQKRFLLQEIAIEMFLQRKNYFFNFLTTKRLLEFMTELQKKIPIVTNRREEFKNKNYQDEWTKGLITNFQYLMLVNTYAGRTYNDLSQYFIFPWVLQNYRSQYIDFTWNSGLNLFRDLKLPIGAIQRTVQVVQEEYSERDRNNLEENFMYGSHYSNAAIVFNYLIRLEPFNELHFSLQKNKFDVADRLFSNINILWENSLKQDNKELIPEFYYMPEFLQNINYFDFGTLQSAHRVTDVTLPKWVKTQTAEEFIYRMRQALESDEVSMNLNHWIDLIFGVNNYGKNAADNVNLFHYLTYEQNVKQLFEKIQDESLLKSYITQIYYFGQTPQQLFLKPHNKKTKCFNLFTNQIPNFHFCKDADHKSHEPLVHIMEETTNEIKSEILSIYPYSKKSFYIVKGEFEKNIKIKLIEAKTVKESFYQFSDFKQKQSQTRLLLQSSELKLDSCNPQNLFTFVYDKRFPFGDGFDSSSYSLLLDNKPSNLYFCLVGFLDKSIQFYDIKNKMTELKVENPAKIKRQKRATCVRFHALDNLLAIGALDGWLQVYRIQFSNFILKEIFSNQLRASVMCVDISDLYILAVDQRHYATLYTIEGDQLHLFHIDSNDFIYQCIIQMHFLIFKSNNSFIFVFTLNGESYVAGHQLSEHPSKNILFTTPFSSKFAFLQPTQLDQQNYYIQFYDIFDLKLFQQQLGNQKSEKVSFPRFLEGKQHRIATTISAIHIVFDLELQSDDIRAYYIIGMDDVVNYYFDKNFHQHVGFQQKFLESGIQTNKKI